MTDHQGAPSSSQPPNDSGWQSFTSHSPPRQEEVPLISPPHSSEVDLPEPGPELELELELVTLTLVQWRRTKAFDKVQKVYTKFFRGTASEDRLNAEFPNLCTATYDGDPENQIDWSFGNELNGISPNGKYWLTDQSKIYAELVRTRRADLQNTGTTPSQMGTSKRRVAFGPYKPDLRCGWFDGKIWFLVQEVKKDNHSTGLAQLLWYLVFAHGFTGCYLGVVISGHLLQRLYMFETTIFVETTDEKAANADTLGVAEVFSDLEEKCPMPLQLFDKSADGAAIPNEQGLGAYLEIVTRANRLAFEAIRQGLERVPAPIAVDVAAGSALLDIVRRTERHPEASVRARTTPELSMARKRKYRAAVHDDDDHVVDDGANDRAAGHHKAKERRTIISASTDSPTSRTVGTSTLLSFDAVATLDDAVGQIPHDWINTGKSLIDNNIEYDSATPDPGTEDVKQMAPSDSGSWRFDDEDQDEDEVLPSHLILTVEALGYRVRLVTVTQMDALIRLPSTSSGTV